MARRARVPAPLPAPGAARLYVLKRMESVARHHDYGAVPIKVRIYGGTKWQS